MDFFATVPSAASGSLFDELKLIRCALQRKVPQNIRQKARLNYKVRYLFSITVGFGLIAYRCGDMLVSATICWTCQLFKCSSGIQFWRYRTFRSAVKLASSSMHITAYQAGCFSARWGILLDTVSCVGSRILLAIYQICYRHTDYFSSNSLAFPLSLKNLGKSIWMRALYAHRCTIFLTALTVQQVYKRLGYQSYKCNEYCRIYSIELLTYKLNIPLYEMAVVSPNLINIFSILIKIVQFLVEYRLLKGPFPSQPT